MRQIPLCVVFAVIAASSLGQTQQGAGGLPGGPGKAVPGKDVKSPLRHDDAVNGLAFSPDGKTLASVSDDGTVRLWDVPTGKELRQWHGHKGRVFSVAFSPDGKIVASGGEDMMIWLWDVATGKMLRRFEGQGGTVYGLAFSPEKSTLLASCAELINLWQVPDGKRLHSFNKEILGVTYSVSFSAGGTRLASGGDDVLVWSILADDKDRIFPPRAQKYRGHPGVVDHVAISPDLKYLASGGREALILWNLEEVQKLHEWKLFVRSPIVFTPDGKTMIAGVDDLTTTFWDVASKKELKKLPKKRSDADALALSSDGKTLATAGWQRTIHLWDMSSGEEIVPGKKK